MIESAFVICCLDFIWSNFRSKQIVMIQSSHLTKVSIHAVPRSGTSWIGEIINSSPNTAYRFQPLFSYAHKDFLSVNSTNTEINDFFHRLLHCGDEFTNQSEKRKNGEFPTFEKNQITHVVYKEVRYINILKNLMKQSADLKLVCVIRSPLSVINSWLQAPKEFRKDLGWSKLNEWRYAKKKNLDKPEEFNGFEKWKEATTIFSQLEIDYPTRVHITKYSDMLSNPVEGTESMFEFLGLKMTDATYSFLKDSSQKSHSDPYSVYRKNQSDDKWKVELAPEIQEQIMIETMGTKFEKYVISR